ncbi:MAG: OprO/OprP family phosphate-selective porin [Gemmataceae bacterium]|nr:OprO/OprP family phosphate-selective porin [Gemmataceae bacterium]
MRRILRFTIALAFALLTTRNASADAPAEANGGLDAVLPTTPNRVGLESYWENGYHLASSDGQFRLHIGGNAQLATTWLIGPDSAFVGSNGQTSGIGNSQGTFFRRIRLRMDGSIWSQFDYAIEYDFANAANENDGIQEPTFNNLTSAPVPCNVWMQVRDLPVFGTVRLGNQVKPIGFTNNTPQTMLPFVERADNMDAFYAPFDNGFALGVTSRHVTESERMTGQVGIYQPAVNSFGVALNKWAVGGRITGLPMDEDEGQRLVHLGIGTWISNLPQDQIRVRARTILRNGPGFAVPVLVDTGTVSASHQAIIAPELAVVYGPWTLQAEYAGQYVTQVVQAGQSQGTVYYHGGYVQALYFLTGEHQAYSRTDGAFGRVMPRNNFHVTRHDDSRTFGAWQAGARFSYADLTDKGIDGGKVYDMTLGLNWFLNPNMKLQMNYILERRDAPNQLGQFWINGVGLIAGYDF